MLAALTSDWEFQGTWLLGDYIFGDSWLVHGVATTIALVCMAFFRILGTLPAPPYFITFDTREEFFIGNDVSYCDLKVDTYINVYNQNNIPFPPR